MAEFIDAQTGREVTAAELLPELVILPEAMKLCTGYQRAIDIGAHRGDWTDVLASYFEETIAFEPTPYSYQLLCARFKDSMKVAPIEMAVSDRCGAGRVILPGKRTKSSSRYLNPTRSHEGIPVTVVSLDSMSLHYVDLIKIDVEGAELKVLMGGEKLIKDAEPVIVVECIQKHLRRYGHSIGMLHDWMVKRGYEMKLQQNIKRGCNRIYAPAGFEKIVITSLDDKEDEYGPGSRSRL